MDSLSFLLTEKYGLFGNFWVDPHSCCFVFANELIGSRSDGEEWFREEHIFQGKHFDCI